jgi:spore coat protein H
MVRRALLAALFVLPGAWVAAGQAGSASKTFTQDQLFQRTKVWTAELKFARDQWTAIKPKQGQPTGRSRFTGGEWLQGAQGERNGWSATRGIHFDYGHADLTFDGVEYRNVAVRLKGNGTFNGDYEQAKNSYKIDLNKYVKGQKIAGVSTLNFHNTIRDPGFITEALAFRLYRDAGVPSSRTAYVRVSITVEGRPTRYAGLYQLVENVDDNFLGARFPSAAGPLLKPVSVAPFSDLGDVWNGAYAQAFDPKDDLTPAEQKRLIDMSKLIQSGTDGEFSARIGSFVDVDAFARYMSVVMWINNYDSILRNGQNYYTFTPASTGKMLFIPWDQDDSFGQFFQQAPGSAEVGSIYQFPDRVRFLDRMMALPAFRTAYLGYMRRFNETIFEPGRFPPQVAELSAVTRPFIAAEPSGPGGRGPSGLGGQFEARVSGTVGLLPFTVARWKSVSAQLANPK